MFNIRKSADRGHFDHGWLDTYHTFSFADYDDPAHMGFRSLRVMNEDRVAPDGADGSLKIEQDARIYLANITPSTGLTFDLAPGRHAWLQVLRGSVSLNNNNLTAGDGVAISNEPKLSLAVATPAELMLFDLA